MGPKAQENERSKELGDGEEGEEHTLTLPRVLRWQVVHMGSGKHPE